jgi:hypothetical protein
VSWLVDRAVARLAEELAEHLTPLEARLRKRAISAVAEAVVHDTRHDYAADEALVAALARVAERCLAEVERIDAESSALFVSYQQALDERERRELLTRTLTATERPGRALREDLEAVGRWLDVEALRERASTRISDHIDEVLVCHGVIRSKLARASELSPLLAAARDTGLIETALRHAAPGQRAVVRTAALHTLASLARAVAPEARSRR